MTDDELRSIEDIRDDLVDRRDHYKGFINNTMDRLYNLGNVLDNYEALSVYEDSITRATEKALEIIASSEEDKTNQDPTKIKKDKPIGQSEYNQLRTELNGTHQDVAKHLGVNSLPGYLSALYAKTLEGKSAKLPQLTKDVFIKTRKDHDYQDTKTLLSKDYRFSGNQIGGLETAYQRGFFK